MSDLLPYVCDCCGAEWRNPISASMCCDAIANDLDDEWIGYN